MGRRNSFATAGMPASQLQARAAARRRHFDIRAELADKYPSPAKASAPAVAPGTTATTKEDPK
jgi:hypothetical protein